VQAGFHRAFGDAEAGRDLGNGQVRVVTERDDDRVIGVKLGECPRDLVAVRERGARVVPGPRAAAVGRAVGRDSR